MKPIYRDKSQRARSRRARSGARSQPACPPLQLGKLRAALFAAVGLAQVGCPNQQEVIVREGGTPAGVSAGETGGEAAGEVAGTTAGATAGTSAGAIAGTSAGEVAGTTAGAIAGTSAGEVAGTTAGEVAGTTAGEVAGTTAGEVAGTIPPDCERRPDVNGSGEPNGYEVCDNGRAFRVGPATCTPPEASNSEACIADVSDCVTDSDCTDGPNGRCLTQFFDGPIDDTYCGCRYFCERDADCGAGEVCECVNGNPGVCRVANCEESADCESGVCELSRYTDGCDFYNGFFCRTEADSCHVDNGCDPESRQCSVAPFGDDESWACYEEFCAIGRPAIVDDEQLCADLVRREGWGAVSDALHDVFARLTAEERALLIARWSEVAALEHSSVASFARVTLELMGLGAPAEIILETQRAAADEVEHAREAYGLLASLLGRPVGPGDFPVSALTPRLDRREITLSVAREACLGETLGVAEVEGALALARAHSGPREVIDHLERVAADETKHAGLAWRTLAWLLEGASPSLYDEVAEVLTSEAHNLLSASGEEMDAPTAARLGHLGLLSEAQRLACYSQGLSEVLVPCAQELLGADRVRSLKRLARRVKSA